MRRTKAEMMAGVPDTAARSKIVAKNTVEYYTPDGSRYIRFHLTDILRFAPDGSITLNTGGWTTVTTKARLNEFLPSGIYVFSHKKEWFVNVDGERELPFEDGMVINKEPDSEWEKYLWRWRMS